MTQFEAIRDLDRTYIEGIEYLAVIYRQLGEQNCAAHLIGYSQDSPAWKLNQLSYQLLQISRKRPESWFASGLHFDLKGEHEKAIQMMDTVIYLDPFFSLAFKSKGKISAVLAALEDSDPPLKMTVILINKLHRSLQSNQ